MPTGYTAMFLDNPSMTFEQWALRCARAFGALVHMRDDGLDADIPDKVEPYDYHRGALDEAYERARRYETMTLDAAKNAAQVEYEAAVKSRKESDTSSAEEKRRHDEMRAKVEAWKPPTPEHEDMKKFMLDQIRISEPTPFDWAAPKLLSAEEWLSKKREDAAKDIEYHARHWREDQERARKATEWLRALRTSLEVSAEREVRP